MSSEICGDFKRGDCDRGRGCRFSHDIDKLPDGDPRKTRKAEALAEKEEEKKDEGLLPPGTLIRIKYAGGKTSGDNIYVRGIPKKANDSLVRKVFEQHGEVAKVRIMKMPGFPDDASFVQMSEEEDATAALKALNGEDANTVFGDADAKVKQEEAEEKARKRARRD